MSIFKWLKKQFVPPKTDRQIFEEQAWKNLQYRKSEEGKWDAAFEKELREIESKYADDINPWQR